MRGESCGAEEPGGQDRPSPTALLLCSDPRAARIVAALQALRDVADTTVASGEDAARLVLRADVDLIVADEWVGTTDGRELLSGALRNRPASVGILLTGSRHGAASAELDGLVVLPKLVDPAILKTVCGLALDCAALRRRLATADRPHPERATAPAPRTLEPLGLESYEGLLVRSASMRAVLKTLRELEASDVTVLIQGETGTGKELVARAIHARSRRREGPFLPVNLGAVSDSLRESELFGHVRGAFTGAHGTRGGLFLSADRGCLFLDEVGEASPALQVALLRVLEEGTIMPLGADRSRHVDVRIISATNQNLAQLARHDRFRRDLFYRLNVFPIRLPPLRERVEDVLPLANHFLHRAARALKRPPVRLSHEARVALEAHLWEGNVRELRSVMERAVLTCKGNLVQVDHLPLAGDGEDEDSAGPGVELPSKEATLRELERQMLVKTLTLADGNQSQAARILGVHESTFRFRLRRAGITTPRRAASS